MSKEVIIPERVIVVDISTDEALAALEQKFKENIEAGAPKELVEQHLKALKETQNRMADMYIDAYLMDVK